MATNQGHRQPPHGSPPQALASEEERMRLEVDPHFISGVYADAAGTAFVKAAKEQLARGVQNLPVG